MDNLTPEIIVNFNEIIKVFSTQIYKKMEQINAWIGSYLRLYR